MSVIRYTGNVIFSNTKLFSKQIIKYFWGNLNAEWGSEEFNWGEIE